MVDYDRQSMTADGVFAQRDGCDPRRSLWCAVIREQFFDATGVRSKKISGRMPDAQEWFETVFFHTCCSLAEVDAELIYNRVQSLLALPLDQRIAKFNAEVGDCGRVRGPRRKRALSSLSSGDIGG